MRVPMTVFLSALAFFLLITGLIVIHECGHYIAAKLAKVTVDEFGFGLPPKAKKLFRWRGTDFTLNWIPFGGFVRLRGENGEANTKAEKGSFVRASIPVRCAILTAGVFMNFLVAIVIFWFGFSQGRWIPTYMSFEQMQSAANRGEIHLSLGVAVNDVLEGGTASQAGLPTGIILLKVDGTEVQTPQQVVDAQQGKSRVIYSYAFPDARDEVKTATVRVSAGKTGVVLQQTTLDLSAPKRSLVTSLGLAFRETRVVTGQTILGIGKLFTSLAEHGTVPEGVTGIVGIAQLTYSSVQKGFMVYLRLVALLSLSLAVLNILPFPALDGGRLVFVLSELFVKPGKRRFEALTNTVGFGFLLLVILIVTLYDIIRLFA